MVRVRGRGATLMNQPIVSQEEISALLEGFSDERLASAPQLPPLAREASDADISRAAPDRFPAEVAISPDALPALDAIHRQFALALSSRLSSTTGCSLRVHAEPAQIQQCEQLLGAGPVQVHYFNLHRPMGSCVMVLQSAWLRSYVDLLFGGDGRSGPAPRGDELSATEQQATRKLLALFCQQYMLAWRSRYALQLQWRRSESSISALRDAARDQPLLGTALDFRCNEVTGRVWVLFPQATLLPLARQFEAAPATPSLMTPQAWSWPQAHSTAG